MKFHFFLFLNLLFLLGLASRAAEQQPGHSLLTVSNNTNTVIGEMPFVPVRDLGNPQASDDNYGAVPYAYQIGKYDVTAEEYCAFLNAVAATGDPHGLYNTNMASDVKIACIQRSIDSSGHMTYTIINDNDHQNREKFPITYVSWYSAARFCNWMEHSCPTGNQVVDGTTETGSYTFHYLINDTTHYAVDSVDPNRGATYFIPTEDEWYKAAYFVNHGSERDLYWNYPTQSDLAPGNTLGIGTHEANYRCGYFENSFTKKEPPYLTPVGSFARALGPYKTYDMGGNVFQWTSSRFKSQDPQSFFVARGGSWNSTFHYYGIIELSRFFRCGFDPAVPRNTIGFRLVKIATPPL